MSFQREADGSLREGHTFANDGRRTGGVTDPLESQGSLTLSQDHSLLFAVDGVPERFQCFLWMAQISSCWARFPPAAPNRTQWPSTGTSFTYSMLSAAATWRILGRSKIAASCRACRLGHDDISSKRFIRPPFSGRLYLMLRLEPEGEWRGLERRNCECENQDCWIELHE